MDRPLLFGKFCLLERVSVGGMAEVFRVKPLDSPDPKRYFALKRILPHLAEDDDFIKMFIDEARLTVQLRHPNVVQNYELGQFQSSHYIVMEFIAGQDLLALQKHVRRQKTIVDVSMTCHILREVAKGMDYVHRKTDEAGDSLGIIHRDISPQNVLVSWDGKVRVIDFGIAKAASQSTKTQAGVLKGKYGYMSPEQVRAKDIDHRSDIFSMGTLFWELLTNQRLFKAANQYEVLTLIGDPDIKKPSTVNPSITPEVDKIAMKALARDPNDRYQWPGEFADDLHRFLKSQRPPYHQSQLTSWIRSAFDDDYQEEREKRKRFQHINTADDVRRIFDENYGKGGKDEDEETHEATEIWDVDVVPDTDQDLSAFVSNHTVVQAGGLDLLDYGEWEDAPDTVDETQDGMDQEVRRARILEPEFSPRSDFEVEKTKVTRETAALGAVGSKRELPPMEAAPTPPQGVKRVGPDPVRSTSALPVKEVPNPSASVNPIRMWTALIAVLIVVVLLSGVVLVVVGENEEGPDAVAQAVGSLLINVRPPTDIEIMIDGEVVGDQAPLTLRELEVGEYDLEVRHPAYYRWRGSVAVEAGGVEMVDVDLRAEGDLVLFWEELETPEELRVYINEELVVLDGEVEIRRRVPRGEYLIEAVSPEIRPLRQRLIVEVEQETRKELDWVPLLQLHLTGDEDLEVFLNDNSFGELPLIWSDLNPRRLYEVRVGSVSTVLGYPEIASGTLSVEELVEIAGRSEEDYGWLTVDTGEGWWQIFIDGVDSGLTSPIDEEHKIPVIAGTHTVLLQRGEQRRELSVRVFPRETTNLRRILSVSNR